MKSDVRQISQRDANLDLLRIVAIALVVLQHSPNDGSSIVLGAISYLCVPGALLFFMVSGALLLGSEMPTMDFLKKRFTKVLWPTLFWTAFYLIVSWVKSPVSIGEAAKQICAIPFEPQGTGVLWFMYALAGLYLLTPILSRWISTASNKELLFYLALWLVAMSYPWLVKVLDITMDEGSPFYYFAGYVGYYVAGYVIVKRGLSLPIKVALPLLLAVVSIPFVLKLTHHDPDYNAFYYTSLYAALYTVLLFILLRQVPVTASKMLTTISNLTFGVYLIHIFIVRDVLWQVMPYSPISLIVIPLAAMLISLSIVWLIAKTRLGNYLIGFRFRS